MPKNLEVKVTISSFNKALDIARSLGASYVGEIHQVDTYFGVQQGRLKLREANDKNAELIFYDRDEHSTQRVSYFQIYPINSPQQLKQILAEALGNLAIVEKKRKVFLYDSTRIHIDDVKGLGGFLEFEVPIHTTLESATKVMNYLIDQFRIDESDFISVSYLDLMLKMK
ncbi:MAG: class IV adenylate cyclase [Ignavibacteriae bacterium]|nr:class IV adenylate cyclase [Ignavibacteriota bacterium]